MSRAKLLIHKDRIVRNVKKLHEFSGKKLVAVIKSNAYGMGAVNLAKLLEPLPEVDSFAVACVEEGATLRQAGVQKDILVLGGVLKEEVSFLKNYRLTPVISDFKHLEAIKGLDIKFHVKYDTGMGRLGFLKEVIKDPRIEGVMSHFSTPTDREFSLRQVEKFRSFVSHYSNVKVHMESSAGMIYKVPFTTHIRVGLAIYGEKPLRDYPIELEPAVSLKARLISVKSVPEGYPISYGKTYITPKEMRIGIVAFGYADGLMKSLSNKGYMFYGGKRLKILGSVTMDMSVIDLSDTEASVGDYVYLVGEGQSFVELSKLAGTIPYEIMCNVGERVQRVIV